MRYRSKKKKWVAYKSGLTVPLEDYATILILTLIHNSKNRKFVFPQIHQSILTTRTIQVSNIRFHKYTFSVTSVK